MFSLYVVRTVHEFLFNQTKPLWCKGSHRTIAVRVVLWYIERETKRALLIQALVNEEHTEPNCKSNDRVVKVFAMGIITRDFTMFLPAGKNTFGHGYNCQ